MSSPWTPWEGQWQAEEQTGSTQMGSNTNTHALGAGFPAFSSLSFLIWQMG